MLHLQESRDARDALAGSEGLDPIQRLMLAVLEDAVMTFQHGVASACPKRRRQFLEVEDWLRSRDIDSPFAFESICAELRLEPGNIRNALWGLRRHGLEDRRRAAGVSLRRTAVQRPRRRRRAVASAG